MGDSGLPTGEGAEQKCTCSLCLGYRRLGRLIHRYHQDPVFQAVGLSTVRVANNQLEDHIDTHQPVEKQFVAAAVPLPPLHALKPKGSRPPAVGESAAEKPSGEAEKKDRRRREGGASSSKRRRKKEAKSSKSPESEKKESAPAKGKEKKSREEPPKKKQRGKESSGTRSPPAAKEEPSSEEGKEGKEDPEKEGSPALEFPTVRAPPREDRKKRDRSPSPQRPPGDFVLRPRSPSTSPPRRPTSSVKPPEPAGPPPRVRRDRRISSRSKGIKRDHRNEEIYQYGFSDHRKRWREEEDNEDWK